MKWCALTDVLRTDFRQDVELLYSLISQEIRAQLDEEIEKYTAIVEPIPTKRKAA